MSDEIPTARDGSVEIRIKCLNRGLQDEKMNRIEKKINMENKRS